MRNILGMIGMILAAFGQSALAAQTMEQLLASAQTPQEQGLAIAKEADRRASGFDNFEVDVRMVLFNAGGDSTERKMRSKTLEMADGEAVAEKILIIFDLPRDVAGTTFMTFSKALEPDDQWLYLPSLKRVKRISSKNKSGPFMGSEFAYEDISSQEVEKYAYQYLRTEACGALQCAVVERKPLYEHSGYTRHIAWIDTQEFRVMKVDYYDRKEELLKTLTNDGYALYIDRIWRAAKMTMTNHQKGKYTELHWENYRFHTGLKDSDFTTAKLKQAR